MGAVCLKYLETTGNSRSVRVQKRYLERAASISRSAPRPLASCILGHSRSNIVFMICSSRMLLPQATVLPVVDMLENMIDLPVAWR